MADNPQITKLVKYLHRYFTKEDTWISDRYIKNSQYIWVSQYMEMQTKIINNYLPTRMVKVDNTDSKCWWGYRATGTYINY